MNGSVAIDQSAAERIHYAARRGGHLPIWTVYERPLDFPDLYIARPFIVEAGQPKPLPVHLQATTLDAVRAMLPADLYRMDRNAGDEPRILESWL